MCSDAGDWTCLQPGFPIRKSSDHSLVIDSPRLIADSYVLLRFLVPRHPPCALKNLNATKMLSSTVKFSKYNRHPTPTTASCDLGRAHDQKKPAGTPPDPLRKEQAQHCVARSFRTQQRVRHRTRTLSLVPLLPKQLVLEVGRPGRCQIIDVPPLSTRCPTLGDRPGCHK